MYAPSCCVKRAYARALVLSCNHWLKLASWRSIKSNAIAGLRQRRQSPFAVFGPYKISAGARKVAEKDIPVCGTNGGPAVPQRRSKITAAQRCSDGSLTALRQRTAGGPPSLRHRSDGGPCQPSHCSGRSLRVCAQKFQDGKRTRFKFKVSALIC